MSSNSSNDFSVGETRVITLGQVLAAAKEARAIERADANLTLEKFLASHEKLSAMWEEFVDASKTCRVEPVHEALFAMLKLQPEKWTETMQTIEKLCRKLNVGVFLIARSESKSITLEDAAAMAGKKASQIKLAIFDASKVKRKYFLHIVVNPLMTKALPEVLFDSESYAINYHKLGDCGVQEVVMKKKQK